MTKCLHSYIAALACLACITLEVSAAPAEKIFIQNVVSDAPDVCATKIEHELTARGYTVYGRRQYELGGGNKRTAIVLTWGSPEVANALAAASATATLDMPFRVLVYADERGATRYVFNSARDLAQRHQIRGRDDVIARLESDVNAIAERLVK